MAMPKLLLCCCCCCCFFFFLLAAIADAREFIVGGRAHAWKVPSPTDQTLNQWAETMRFQVGDSLLWILGGTQKDSVLEVTRADYLTCNTSSPIADYTYGTAVVKLDRSGPYYFIGGVNGACEKGQKVAVVVMGQHHDNLIVAGEPSMAPAPEPTSGGSRTVFGVSVVTMVGLGMLGLLL